MLRRSASRACRELPVNAPIPHLPSPGEERVALCQVRGALAFKAKNAAFREIVARLFGDSEFGISTGGCSVAS